MVTNHTLVHLHNLKKKHMQHVQETVLFYYASLVIHVLPLPSQLGTPSACSWVRRLKAGKLQSPPSNRLYQLYNPIPESIVELPAHHPQQKRTRPRRTKCSGSAPSCLAAASTVHLAAPKHPALVLRCLVLCHEPASVCGSRLDIISWVRSAR